MNEIESAGFLAREWCKTEEEALTAARQYARASGAEDVWVLTNGLYMSFPTSLRDLGHRLEPGGLVLIENVTQEGA